MKQLSKKLVVVLLTLFMLIPTTVMAQDPTVRDKINEKTNFHDLSEGVLVPLELHLKTDNPEYTGYVTTTFGTAGIGDGVEFTGPGIYSVTYHDALDYMDSNGNHKLTLKVDLIVNDFHPSGIHNGIKTDDSLNTYYNGVEIKEDGRMLVSSYYKDDKDTIVEQFDTKNSTTNYSVKYTFYEGAATYGNEFKFHGLVGIEDPDNANYLFDTSKTVYFLDAEGQEDWNKGDYASNAFTVASNGLFRILPSTTEVQRLGGFKEAGIYIDLNNESSFEFDIQGWRDRIHLPELYVYRRYTVTYLDGADETVWADTDEVFPGIPYGEKTPSFIPPERPGYTFMGWDKEVAEIVTEDAVYIARWEKNVPYVVEYYYQKDGKYSDTPDDSDKSRTAFAGVTVVATDEDKTPTKDAYVLDSAEEKNNWSDAVVDDADNPTTLKVYFKEQFTVIYKPGTEGTFPTKTTEHLDYGAPIPTEPDTSLHNDGYDFDGWDQTLEDPVTRNMTYVAQWKPWTYTIIYNANGGSGKMEDQVYFFKDDPMNSKENEFTRDGYRFVGFLYTDPDGNKTLYKSINDFRSEFIEKLGKFSTIELVAQWEKLPEPMAVYAPPTTGVE